MIAKSKAEDLAEKFKDKQLALIAVEEIKKALIDYAEDVFELQNMDSELRYWDEVEVEINLIKFE